MKDFIIILVNWFASDESEHINMKRWMRKRIKKDKKAVKQVYRGWQNEI